MKLNRTVFRVTQLLELLMNYPDGLTLSEITRELDVPKSSVFDILQTLKQTHFLHEKNKRFAIGFKVEKIGEAYGKTKDIILIVRDKLIDVANRLQLTGSLVIYKNDGLEYVLQHRPAGSIVDPGASKGHGYLHASASGKVLLAFMDEGPRKKILNKIKWTQFTEHTIDSKERFLTELEKVRKMEYAADAGEFNSLLTCVSAPIFDGRQIVAALTLSGLQLSQQQIIDIAAELLKTTHDISEQVSV